MKIGHSQSRSDMTLHELIFMLVQLENLLGNGDIKIYLDEDKTELNEPAYVVTNSRADTPYIILKY